MSYANRCQVCDGQPLWGLTREGDAAASWACAEHVSQVMLDLQRDHEVTRIVVRHYPKAVEWAEVSRALTEVAREG